MKREQAERITTQYLKAIYGFVLKRCTNLQDAEDLSQEIAFKVFRTLLVKDDIKSLDQFIWTVAHNSRANYYRGRQQTTVGLPIDELAEVLPSKNDTLQDVVDRETADHLHMKIACLSKLQRRIVIAYYYENKKQETIASELGIPLGTVKWHLFEAKKELKRGMEMMRQSNELKFNPIHFELCGTNGSPGTKGPNVHFFRSALSQNIVYDVWKGAKTINEIAVDLGVSPVYVESEAEYLAEYGFLLESKGKYLCNILVNEASDQLIALHDEMYQQAAKIFANALFDALTSSGILRDSRIICWQTDEPISLTEQKKADDNFILWSLIPYIAALSGENLMDKSVSFEEAATLRPDGGHNICQASVMPPNVKPSMYFDSMKQWCGPCWNQNKDYILWQIDSEWSERRVDDSYITNSNQILALLSKMKDGGLTEEEYTFLAQMGIIKTSGNDRDLFTACLQIVWLENAAVNRELLHIGAGIKEKHWAEFQAAKAPFDQAVLDVTPKHLHKMQKFGLQYTFFSDGWFILHCLKELLNNGKLKLPTENQKKVLTTLLVSNM